MSKLDELKPSGVRTLLRNTKVSKYQKKELEETSEVFS